MMGRNATYPTEQSNARFKMVQQTSFPATATTNVTLPVVKDTSITIYEQYVRRGEVMC